MSTRNQQRRAEKKRRAAQARRQTAETGASSQDFGRRAAYQGERGGGPTVGELISMGARLARSTTPNVEVSLDEVVDRLVDCDGRARSSNAADDSVALQLSSALVKSLGVLWETGWQPLDVVHLARREFGPRTVKLAACVIGVQAMEADLFDVMPPMWADQLSTLGARQVGSGDQSALTRWRAVNRVGLPDALLDGLRLLGLVGFLPPVQKLMDPPSRWAVSFAARSVQAEHATDPRGATGAARAASAKTLATIRALLAKAEATTFAAEAEAFAAKAQELMTRYSIDAALIDGRHGADLAAGVVSQRVHIDNPYAKEKVQLLSVVAIVNGGRVVYSESYGFGTVVGFPADLQIIDMLFTSLLVQATRAMNDATATNRRGTSPAFRRAFWIAYAVRVHERLDEAKQQAAEEATATYGTALVPVLTERIEAVDATIDRLFQNTTKMKSRQVDAQGWHAGREAADRASLATQRPLPSR